MSSDFTKNSADLPLNYWDKLSCFETLRVYHGKIFLLDKHMARLAASCKGIGCELPCPASRISQWIEEGLFETGLKEALLRFSVHWQKSDQGECVLLLREFTPTPWTEDQPGVSVVTSATRRDSFKSAGPGIKSSSYVGGILAVIESKRLGIHETIQLNEAGFVTEGTIANIFLVKEKRILTPKRCSGILMGVTRDLVIELAKNREIEVQETLMSRHELYTADECFLTNTSFEILPVGCVDSRVIASGTPGPVTRILSEDFRKKFLSL